MAEITKEQTDKASNAFGNEYDYQKGLGANREICERRGLNAAAPYLQLPWDEPTLDEANSAFATYENAMRNQPDIHNYKIDAMFGALGWLIASRNPTLLPKPVDLRLDKIVAILERSVWAKNDHAIAAAEKILGVLDEEK